MATQGVATWSTTAASNATADPNVNWAEGQAPSTVNNSARDLMRSVALWRNDLQGITTGGTSTAYTLTSNQTYASLTAMDGALITLFMHTTCGAAPTLAVDGLTAKALHTDFATAVASGSLVANALYTFRYNNSDGFFYLLGAGGAPPFATNTAMVFVQTSAPTGWTKSTTHNDKALRIVSGSASTGGSTAFTSVFASRTIAQANLPNVNFSAASLTGTITTHIRTDKADLAAGSVEYATNLANSLATATDVSTIAFGGSVPSGGSGTALDFAVAYVDCIIATKD